MRREQFREVEAYHETLVRGRSFKTRLSLTSSSGTGKITIKFGVIIESLCRVRFRIVHALAEASLSQDFLSMDWAAVMITDEKRMSFSTNRGLPSSGLLN